MHPFASLDVPIGSIGIHWFGQNSFALKDAEGTTLYVDPYFPSERPSETFIHSEKPIQEADLPVDYAVLTHDHWDHIDVETLSRVLAAFPKARYVGPRECMERLRKAGFSDELLLTVKAGQSVQLGSVVAHAVWSKPMAGLPEHGISPPNVEHLGYVLDMDGVRVYITGDLVNPFAEIDELIQPVLDLRPDIGLLTTHPTEGEFPFFEGSVQMAVRLQLKAAVPAHYQLFVKRNYDPQAWAAAFPKKRPKPLIIPYNTSIVYTRDV